MSTALREGDLLTVAQALSLLPVGKSLLYELAAEGVLPSVRVASGGSRRGRILLFRSGIDDYVARLRARSVQAPPPRVDVDGIIARVRAGVTGSSR